MSDFNTPLFDGINIREITIEGLGTVQSLLGDALDSLRETGADVGKLIQGVSSQAFGSLSSVFNDFAMGISNPAETFDKLMEHTPDLIMDMFGGGPS